jgi:hypothetical protein
MFCLGTGLTDLWSWYLVYVSCAFALINQQRTEGEDITASYQNGVMIVLCCAVLCREGDMS